MALAANTQVASTIANYFLDNFTALQQAGGTPPPASTYTTPPPSDWKENNKDNKFYLIGSGATYKLASVSGNNALPEGAVPVDLNVAYAIQAKELSLTDWVLARVSDEIRQSLSMTGFQQALSSVPEADVNFDLSTLNQSDLKQLLQQLVKVSADLQSAVAAGHASDRLMAATALGLSASRLAEAIEQQKLFESEANTLVTSSGESDTADNFNEVVTAALANLVTNFSAEMDGTRRAYDMKAAVGGGRESVNRLTNTVASALMARLRSAADLAMLATSAQAMFGRPTNVLQSSDGNVIETAAASARQTAQEAVKKLLTDLLKDPALQADFVEAMKTNAEALDTADMNPLEQEALYQAVAASVIQAALADGSVIEQMAGQAVEFGQQLSGWLTQEAESASTRDAVNAEGMA